MAQNHRPKRLLYPSALIDRRSAPLQRDLRRLYRRFRRGELNRLHCLVDGEAAIMQSFEMAQADIKIYLEQHGVTWTGDQSELTRGLEDTLESWRGIVRDF